MNEQYVLSSEEKKGVKTWIDKSKRRNELESIKEGNTIYPSHANRRKVTAMYEEKLFEESKKSARRQRRFEYFSWCVVIVSWIMAMATLGYVVLFGGL